jgi:anti-sigma regulatory factor (Ser/Thr protein kinase)
VQRFPVAEPPATTPVRRVVQTYPATPAAVREARHHVRDALLEWGRGDLEESGSLITTELVTNAMLHAGTEVQVEPVDGGAHVLLVVSDGSSAVPRPRHSGPESSTGRGLRLLEHFSRERGVQVSARGKRVWAVLRADAV